MRFGIAVLVVSAILLSAPVAYCASRVLFIDSYHQGYAWSDDITDGIKINMKIANQLGLKIPTSFRKIASKVIE